MAETLFTYAENGLHLVFEKLEDGGLALLHFGPAPFESATMADGARKRAARVTQIHLTGGNQADHHGEKHTAGSLSARLQFERIAESRNADGLKLEIHQQDAGCAHVISHLQFYTGLALVRSWTEVRNIGSAPLELEYVSSFALTGLAKEGLQAWPRKTRLHVPHSTWYGEGQWRSYTLGELGLEPVAGFSMKRVLLAATGTWPTSNYLSMGGFENTETGDLLLWEIEHNGSWAAEVSTVANTLYVLLSGPTENEHHWWLPLAPGATFVSVPVAVSHVRGGFAAGIAALTDGRRRTRRANQDNVKCPVIFNDYMNCLFGDPTTAKLLPLIDAAAEVGCEYFCIDAGWYSDGSWWDGVGAWLPSAKRFPGGLQEPLTRIHERGMIPGLWLELEVMGIKCPLATQWPDECFFMRRGRRVIDHHRYQLDFRHPIVRAHATAVVKRLVEEYRVGYIKMDYNINAGIGTEVNAASFGDGLLQHNRAYLSWLDDIFAQYPDLVIENCGSGGMRMTHALLARHSIQSSSDQTDYRKYPAILAGCATAVTPEQCAVWSYPLRDGSEEETIFNMVSGMLMRIHQSGHLGELSPARRALVTEGLACYKTYRHRLASSHPFWPLGLPTMQDGWVAFGLAWEDEALLAVWRVNSTSDTQVLPLASLALPVRAVECIYPLNRPGTHQLAAEARQLAVQFPANSSARLYRLRG